MKNKALIETTNHGLITLQFQDYTPLNNSVVKDLGYMNAFTGKAKIIAEFETDDKNEIIKVKGNRLFLQLGTIINIVGKGTVEVLSFKNTEDNIKVRVSDHNKNHIEGTGYKTFEIDFSKLDNSSNVTIVEKETQKPMSIQDVIDELPILSVKDLIKEFQLNKKDTDNLREFAFQKVCKNI